MHILITGATGFLGKNLVKGLRKEKQHILYCLVRNKSRKKDITYLQRKGCKIIRGDITSFDDIRSIRIKCDIIVHLAALLGDYKKREKDYYAVNVEGTKNILFLAQKNHIRRIIYLSTQAVEYKQYNLNDCNYIYGKTKNISEKEIINSGIDYTIIRPGLIYGPNDFKLLPLFKMVKRGVSFFIGDGKNYIQPSYVEDLSEFIIESFHKKYLKKIISPSFGLPIQFKEFIDLISKTMNVNLVKVYIPKELAYIYLILMTPFTKLLRIDPLLTWSRYYFFTQSLQIPKYKPIPKKKFTTYEIGIKNTVNWYTRYNFL